MKESSHGIGEEETVGIISQDRRLLSDCGEMVLPGIGLYAAEPKEGAVWEMLDMLLERARS